MSENFNTGVLLLGVGMVTVFIILALIVLLGNLLIRIVNKYFPEETALIASVTSVNRRAINSNKLAAIVGVVDVITRGKGKVTSVKKED